jgi:hypothetical protein
MQLAKIQLARSIWLFDTAELNPYGINLFNLIEKITDRYSFRQAPKVDALPLAANSLRFDNGIFFYEGSVYEVGLEIFADGVTGDSRSSTIICDAFLAECIAWIASQLSVTLSPTIGKKRAYRSEIVFYADGGLAGISPLLDGISATLGSEIGLNTELTAVSFGTEGRHALFSIERIANAPFEDLKFYSWAILQSAAHIRLINMFGSWAEDTRRSLAENAAEEARQGLIEGANPDAPPFEV